MKATLRDLKEVKVPLTANGPDQASPALHALTPRHEDITECPHFHVKVRAGQTR